MTKKPKASILVVDDNIQHLESIHRHLTYCGFEVIRATDPKRALELSQAIRPDVIIADIRMPGLNGIELIRKFKEVQPDVKVILITGYYAEYEPSIKEALEKGLADHVLQKRYRASELEKLLRDVLKTSSENMLSVANAKAKVLLVDDDVELLEFLSEFFSDRDFATQVAKNAEEALELYQTFEPDAVVTDIGMPHHDGFWLIEKLRQLDPKVRVIPLTAQDNKPVWEKLKEVGITEFFTKPCGVKEMEMIQNRILEWAKTRGKA